ncbi:hypothetical protein DFH09DRAFT_82676 [Mycena vulgaris]|nr:hypothetical protein DFH09DRAFT_82676 [Mycena vulgaris]
MPPRTRKARLMALGPVNTTGLPALPVETLHEIISHFAGAPLPCPSHIARVLSRMHLERPKALRVLSETCRRLRSVFLTPAWERLEACASESVPDTYRFPVRRGFTWKE